MHFFANGFRAMLVRFRYPAPFFLKKEQFAPKIFHKKQNNQTTTCGYENGICGIWTEVLVRNLDSKQYYQSWCLNMLLQIFAGMTVLNSLLLYHCQQAEGHKWIISLISSSGLLMRTITILEKETGGKCYTDSSQIFKKKINAYLNSICKLQRHLYMSFYPMVKMEAKQYINTFISTFWTNSTRTRKTYDALLLSPFFLPCGKLPYASLKCW